MNWVFISIIIFTIIQTGVSGFGFCLLISYIGRVLFLFRLIGTVIPYKVSLGFEAAHLFFVAIGVIFSKGGVDWLSVLLSLLFCGIIAALYWIDDKFYLYVVVDDDDNEEEGD